MANETTPGFINGCNPIQKVQYHNSSGTLVEIDDLPCPSSYSWTKEDISKSTAGRNESGVMLKQKLKEITGLQLAWDYLTTTQAHAVLTAFSTAQYFKVTYLDPLDGLWNGNYFVSKVFYVGDMTSPLYSTSNNRWENVSFNIIATGGTDF